MCFWSADGSAGAPGSERLYIREPVWNLKNVHRRYQKDWNWKLPRTFYVTSFFIEHSCSDFQKGFCKKKCQLQTKYNHTRNSHFFSTLFCCCWAPCYVWKKSSSGGFSQPSPPMDSAGSIDPGLRAIGRCCGSWVWGPSYQLDGLMGPREEVVFF